MSTVIDLFAGAGGLSLGAARAGFKVAAAIEIDANAINTHNINFPNTQHIQKDIMYLTGKDILSISNIEQNELTGIIGGPPCQGFSNIGHGNVSDDRNKLFVRFFELVNELQPSFFLAENVPGIMNKKYDAIRDNAFQLVSNYVILNPFEVKASDYGAPTTRTRIFFIGYKSNSNINKLTIDDIENFKVTDDNKTNIFQALEGLPSSIRYSTKCSGEKKVENSYYDTNCTHIQSDFFYQRVTSMIPFGIGDRDYLDLYNTKHIVNGCIPTKHSPNVKKRYRKLKYGQQDKISKSVKLHPDRFCPTLRAGTGPDKGSYQAVRPIHYKYSRVIMPREAARLQGFPDWFKLPDTIWHSFRQIGNSVSPIAAERVLSAVYQKLT